MVTHSWFCSRPVNPAVCDRYAHHDFQLCVHSKEKGVRYCDSSPSPRSASLPPVALWTTGPSDLGLSLTRVSFASAQRRRAKAFGKIIWQR